MPITANPCIASNNPAIPLLNLLMPCDYHIAQIRYFTREMPHGHTKHPNQ